MINNSGCRREIGLTTTNGLDGELIVVGIYGMEVILNCYDCNVKLFHRKYLRKYFKGLVKLLDMQAGDLYFWDDVGVPKEQKQTRPETKGTSAIQFILTSNITIHCLDLLGSVYVNIFSCKEFSGYDFKIYTQNFFNARQVDETTILRR